MTGWIASRNLVPADRIDAVQLAWDIVEHAERKGGLYIPALRGMDSRRLYSTIYSKIVERDMMALEYIEREVMSDYLGRNPAVDVVMARSIWKRLSSLRRG